MTNPMDKKLLIVSGGLAAFLFSIGVIIGYYGKQGEYNNRDLSESERLLIKHISNRFVNEQDFIANALENVNAEFIRNYHKTLTLEPHIAGRARDVELTNYIKEAWTQMGLENVHLAEYDFYLSWPNQTNPNKIYLLDEADQVRFTTKHKEEQVRIGDDHPDFIHAFNAYSPAGNVTGQLVYVNYGTVEDLAELEQLNLTVKGKICIARYGKIFRGNKVHNCQDRGAIGVILFSDPAEVAPFGTDPGQLYPNTMFLPGSGIQRGSVYIGDGDPLSQDWASIENAYKKKPEDIEGLPKIPAQPIGYDDAKRLLERMGGPPSPQSWRGNISGVDYRLGGEMLGGWKVRLIVNNYQGTVKSSNVIGVITGEVEPDRYVIIGNHRDSWGFGGVDPSSGTAVIMELARSFGELLQQGWRPRRSIIFASWAAEEYGLEGSFEWVYENKDKIMQRSVGLVNVDSCVTGPIAKIGSSPVLQDIMMDGLKHASDPTTNSGRSYYDFWFEWTTKWNMSKPEFSLLASGTDHAAFAFVAGVPAININFKLDYKKYPQVGTYPPYHTGYDTFYLVDKILDPGYKIHRTCTQASLRVLMNLADSLLLPYNLNRFPEQMKKSLDKIENNEQTKALFEKNNVTLRHLKDAVAQFDRFASDFMSKLAKANIRNPMEIRIINDQLMQLERVFLMDKGIPLRPSVKNAIFAPELYNKYSGSAFPAIYDLLHEIHKLEGKALEDRWEQIKIHLSDLMIMVLSAAKFLAPVDQI